MREGFLDSQTICCRRSTVSGEKCLSNLIISGYCRVQIKFFRIETIFEPSLLFLSNLDSTRKCNTMLKEYLKRRAEIKAFPWAMVQFIDDL